MFLICNVKSSENYNEIYGIGKSYQKETAQFNDAINFIRLAASGLDEFIDLIIFIRKNLPKEQAADLIKLLINMLDDISIKDKEICMPMDTLEKSFRELTNIIQEAITAARTK
jgi:hypothetical protein